MARQAIDFHGVIHLNTTIIAPLEEFLSDRERLLACQLLDALNHSVGEVAPACPAAGPPLKLAEAVDHMGKTIRLAAANQTGEVWSAEKKTELLQAVHNALWDFMETLAGCVEELFDQIRQLPLNRWHPAIATVVQTIKEALMHRLEELLWAMRRLEGPIRECLAHRRSPLRRWLEQSFWEQAGLDPRLLKQLRQTERSLRTQYESFYLIYKESLRLSTQIAGELQETENRSGLKLLDLSEQTLYVELFRLLKMWECNPRSGKEMARLLLKSIQQLASVDRVMRTFRSYEHMLKQALFKLSLEWKALHEEAALFQESSAQKLQERVKGYRTEWLQLVHMMSRYRAFMLKSDPNPYVRSRWGFTEWIVAPEPLKAKKLLHMIYAAQEWEICFNRFLEALSHDQRAVAKQEKHARQEIRRLMHEMGQPFLSRSVRRGRIERVLEQLALLDELGSPHRATIDEVAGVLSRVMREDWKYQVLQEFPLFHQLYALHQGLVSLEIDPAHAFRLERFHLVLNRIKEWVGQATTAAHIHEIELDANDMKTYLQDFLAAAQRAVRQNALDPHLEETVHKFRQQLLEYRYLFGQFFAYLLNQTGGDLPLRHQFLFVDQYLESIEGVLHEFEYKSQASK